MKREFADRLKILREEQGYTINGLGSALGVSPASICRWEHGEQDITGDNLIVLAKFFKVSADYLLGLED